MNLGWSLNSYFKVTIKDSKELPVDQDFDYLQNLGINGAQERGIVGELATEMTMMILGYYRMPSQNEMGNGFDGVWRHRGDDASHVILTESKHQKEGDSAERVLAHELDVTKMISRIDQLKEDRIDTRKFIEGFLRDANGFSNILRAAHRIKKNGQSQWCIEELNSDDRDYILKKLDEKKKSNSLSNPNSMDRETSSLALMARGAQRIMGWVAERGSFVGEIGGDSRVISDYSPREYNREHLAALEILSNDPFEEGKKPSKPKKKSNSRNSTSSSQASGSSVERERALEGEISKEFNGSIFGERKLSEEKKRDLQTTLNTPGLTSFICEYIDGPEMEILASQLPTTLRHLSITSSYGEYDIMDTKDPELEFLLTALSRMKNLRSLEINCSLNNEKIKQESFKKFLKIFNYLPRLQILSLKRTGKWGRNVVKTFNSLSSFGNLTSLNLSGNEGVRPSLVNLSHLESLNIGGNNIGDEEIVLLAGEFQYTRNLTSLTVGGNGITDKNSAALMEKLEYLSHLTSLNLSENKIGVIGMNALGKVLSKEKGPRRLTVLNLANNNIKITAMQSLANALKHLTLLEALTLDNTSSERGNEIGDKGLRVLAENLSKTPNLTSLSLRRNKIGVEGLRAFVPFLGQLRLTRLNLGENRLEEEGFLSILTEGLRNLPTLRELGLELMYRQNRPYSEIHEEEEKVNGELKILEEILKDLPGPLEIESGYFLKTKISIPRRLLGIVETYRPAIESLQHLITNDIQNPVFIEHPIDKDGDCGFHGLGLSREEARRQLIEEIERPGSSIHNLLLPDLLDAFRGGDWPQNLHNDQEYQRLRTIYPRGEGTLENEDLRNYLILPEVQRAFIANYISQGGWMTYVRGQTGMLDALAHLNNLRVNIWVPNERDRKKLELVHVANRESTQVVHLIHRDELTHFNFLEIKDGVPKSVMESEAVGQVKLQELTGLTHSVKNEHNKRPIDDTKDEEELQKDLVEAPYKVQRLCETGHEKSQTEKNKELIQELEKKDDGESLYKLGQIYEKNLLGLGVDKDKAKAYYIKALNSGYIKAREDITRLWE